MKPAAVRQRDQRIEMGELVELLDRAFSRATSPRSDAMVDIS